MNSSMRALTALAAGGLMLLGCGGGSASIGGPGDKSKSPRVIEVRQFDDFRYDPNFIAVKPNETVTFRITNRGTRIHEFFLGREDDQDKRESQMADMGSAPANMADKPNSVTIDPGATEELTWSFPNVGTIPFGCHQPGDYGKGMKGTVKVSA